MIFPAQKALFLHSGKTAGSAIEKMMLPEVVDMPYNEFNEKYFYGGNGEVLTQHASAKYMKEKLPKDVWDEYFRFTVVRNPYDRLLSVYHYTHDQHEKRFGTFHDFIMRLPEVLRNESNLWKGSHYLPQHDYAYIDNELVADLVIGFESLVKGVNVLKNTLGITNDLSVYNTYSNPERPKGKAKEQYTDEMHEVMWEIYHKDFINFGYY